MNNLEYLLANDKAALIGTFISSNDISCRYCKARNFCETDGGKIKSCAETRAVWFLQEHAEPDSWDQIEADAKKPCNVYFNCVGSLCEECPSRFSDGRNPSDYYGVDSCNKATRLDLIARCKQLALEGCADGR